MKIPDGPYASQDETHRPEYETLAALGATCGNTVQEAIVRACEICNRYGIDTMSVGGTIAFAMECYENGIIDTTDTGGLEIKWGSPEAVVALTELMARREGFGAVLADGSKRAAERIGRGSEKYAMQVGGREIPFHDPRMSPGQGTFYISDATPAQHCGRLRWPYSSRDGLSVPTRRYRPTLLSPSENTTARATPTPGEPLIGSC